VLFRSPTARCRPVLPQMTVPVSSIAAPNSSRQSANVIAPEHISSPRPRTAQPRKYASRRADLSRARSSLARVSTALDDWPHGCELALLELLDAVGSCTDGRDTR